MEKVIKYNEIKSSDNCKYDGMSLGEVMLRIDPYDVPTARARQLRVSQGGGETNVACGLAYTFGLRSTVLTALVDDRRYELFNLKDDISEQNDMSTTRPEIGNKLLDELNRWTEDVQAPIPSIFN